MCTRYHFCFFLVCDYWLESLYKQCWLHWTDTFCKKLPKFCVLSTDPLKCVDSEYYPLLKRQKYYSFKESFSRVLVLFFLVHIWWFELIYIPDCLHWTDTQNFQTKISLRLCRGQILFCPRTQTEILVSGTLEKYEVVGVSIPVGILPKLWIFPFPRVLWGIWPETLFLAKICQRHCWWLHRWKYARFVLVWVPVEIIGRFQKKSKIHLEPFADAQYRPCKMKVLRKLSSFKETKIHHLLMSLSPIFWLVFV